MRAYRTPGFLGRAGLPIWLCLTALGGWACPEENRQQPDWEIQQHIQRGNQAFSEGRLSIAESEFRKVLKIEDSHAGALHKLARVLVRKAGRESRGRANLYAEAIRALERSVSLRPDGKLAWKDLARTCQLAGRIPGALRAYRKLIELDPQDAGSQAARASLLASTGKHQKAQKAFLKGLADNPDSGALRLAYGRYLLERKQDHQAEKQFLAIKPDAPEYYEALDELGSLAAHRGDFARVRSVYRKLVDMNPNDYMAWELLAAVDEREKDFPSAEEKYRRSLEIDRQHMSAWLGLGRVLRAQNKREEAIYAFRKADGFIGTKPDQALELADELAALSELAWARSVLERARIAARDEQLRAAIEEKTKELGGSSE